MTVEQTKTRSASPGEKFAIELAQRWQEAWNSRDPDRVVSLCTEDIVWEDPLTERPEQGRQAVAEYLRSVWRTFPDLTFTWPEGPYASFHGIKLALHWHVTGTMRGPAEPPGFAPTGRKLEADGVDLLELRGDLVCRYLGIFDMRDSAQQLGLLPAPGSRAEQVAVALQRLIARAVRSRSKSR